MASSSVSFFHLADWSSLILIYFQALGFQIPRSITFINQMLADYHYNEHCKSYAVEVPAMQYCIHTIAKTEIFSLVL
jgi:hypothetical protein